MSAFEQVKAVLLTRHLLLDMCDPARTPRLAPGLRARAKALLEYYPETIDSTLRTRLLLEACHPSIRTQPTRPAPAHGTPQVTDDFMPERAAQDQPPREDL
jgi:hypothetical protein